MARLFLESADPLADRQLREYLDDLASRVEERSAEFPTSDRAHAFTSVVLEALEDLGQIPGAELCDFQERMGRSMGRVNAWYADADDERVDLFTAIHSDEPGTVGRKDVLQAISRAVLVYQEARGGYHTRLEPASGAYDMMQRLHELWDVTDRVRVVVLVHGFAANPGEVDVELEGPELHVDVWDLKRLYRAASSGLPYEPIEISIEERLGQPLSCIAMPQTRADYACYLAIVPGDLLHSLYHEFGPRLLELNVRSFLQAKGKVNKGIRDTLKDEPARFLAYNNGISATAEHVELIPGSDGGLAIRSVTGLQIVNGGQTVASIHRAKEKDGYDLADVLVQAKLTVVKPEQIEELVPKISRYANTQNRVNEADFSANHQFHVKLQQLSQSVWAPGEQTRWFYERARGQHQVARAREGTTDARMRHFDATVPKAQVFDKVDLARYVNSWDQLPHYVSRGGQKNFVHFMEQLARKHTTGWEPGADDYKAIVAQAIVYKLAEKIARQHKFPSYRANAVAYTVSLLSYRTAGRMDLGRIWDDQSASRAAADTLTEWMPIVYEEIIRSAAGRNVTEWCKKEDCWGHVRTVEVQVPSRLEAELSRGQPLPNVGPAAGQQGVSLTADDRENIARVMQVPAEEWIHLTGWGARTGNLAEWQIKIATTLASYAATGWTAVPSSKQAFRGVEMLRTADEKDGRLRRDDAEG
jgi:hypothetical protein